MDLVWPRSYECRRGLDYPLLLSGRWNIGATHSGQHHQGDMFHADQEDDVFRQLVMYLILTPQEDDPLVCEL